MTNATINVTIVDIKYPQGTCFRIFAAKDFSGLFLLLSVFF